MLFSLLYFLVRRLLGAGGRLQDEKDIEFLVLRHQVKVLQRQVKRPRLNSRARPRRIGLRPAPRANRPSGPSPARRPRATLAGSDRTPAPAPPIGQKRASPGSARSSQDGSGDARDGSAGRSCCPARGQGVPRTRRANGRGVPARGGPALLGLQRPRQRARAAAAPGREALGCRRDGAALHGLPRGPAHAASVSVPALPTGTAPAAIGPAGAAVQRPSPS